MYIRTLRIFKPVWKDFNRVLPYLLLCYRNQHAHTHRKMLREIQRMHGSGNAQKIFLFFLFLLLLFVGFCIISFSVACDFIVRDNIMKGFHEFFSPFFFLSFSLFSQPTLYYSIERHKRDGILRDDAAIRIACSCLQKRVRKVYLRERTPKLQYT